MELANKLLLARSALCTYEELILEAYLLAPNGRTAAHLLCLIHEATETRATLTTLLQSSQIDGLLHMS